MGAQTTSDTFLSSRDDTLLSEERARLVRLCARLTGNPGVAEDLAQETLLEAWRNQQKLSEPDRLNPEKRARWLAAIARNICLRWGRSYGRDLAHLAQYTLSAANSEDEPEMDLDDLPSGPADLLAELERDELARLLDRALALLPPTTRAVLIERYIHESPHHEIAERLGLSEDALVQRLYRGKLALRRVMEHDLNAEAAAYGLVALRNSDEQPLEQETRIWCPMCGTSRLTQFRDPATGCISFICPNPVCWQLVSVSSTESTPWQELQSPKAILNRLLMCVSEYYWQAALHGQVDCQACGHVAPTRFVPFHEMPEVWQTYPGACCIAIHCKHCSDIHYNGLKHMTIDVPEALQFWRAHPRMLWLPPREIDYGSQPALLSGFQSYNDAARLDIIYQSNSLHILGIHETTC